MNRLPDAPAIRAAEWEGIAECTEPHCPVCGAACEVIFRFSDGEIVGCDQCITGTVADMVDECFE